MRRDREQLRNFGSDGYLVIPDIVPRSIVVETMASRDAMLEYEAVRHALE